MGLELKGYAAVRARRMRVEKGGDLLLEEVSLEGAEQVFALGQGQPEMLDALMALGEGDDIGDSLFITLIVTQDAAILILAFPWIRDCYWRSTSLKVEFP